MVTNEAEIRYHLEKAFFLAKNQRGGPVLIDVPMDIQRAEVAVESLNSFYYTEEYLDLKKDEVNDEKLEEEINKVVNLIENSKRPIVQSGGGIRLSKAMNELKELIDITGIPVVTTLMGLDSIDNENEKYVGYMGTYGARYSNLAVANCDLLIVLGARLTSRQTSASVKSFARGAKIIHVDIDDNELNLKLKEDVSIKCDLKIFINKLVNKIRVENRKYDFSLWMDKINSYKNQYPNYPTQKQKGKLDPNEVVNSINSFCSKNTVFSLDVGQNKIWASQSMIIKDGQRVLNGGRMAAMGFSIPREIR